MADRLTLTTVNQLRTEMYTEIDPAGSSRATPQKIPTSPEMRFVSTNIEHALRDATRKNAPRTREDARLWLRDEGKYMSARWCFEMLGIDYDAAIQYLERAWEDELSAKTIDEVRNAAAAGAPSLRR